VSAAPTAPRFRRSDAARQGPHDRTPAYRDMLVDLDRVLASAEQTAHTHAWLGEAGLGAEGPWPFGP
jgi:hypothetical protein